MYMKEWMIYEYCNATNLLCGSFVVVNRLNLFLRRISKQKADFFCYCHKLLLQVKIQAVAKLFMLELKCALRWVFKSYGQISCFISNWCSICLS